MAVWIDSHSHLADSRWQQTPEALSGILSEAESAGVRYFLQGGVDPEDWDRQIGLARKHPAVWPAFGLHPYYVASHSEAECESALDLLARKLPVAHALGETGLDFRPRYLNVDPAVAPIVLPESEHRQIAIFEAQLEIASALKMPVVLHIVRAFAKALQVVDLFLRESPRRGMVHSFNGSLPEAEAWVERGFLISVGGPVCRPDNHRLHQAVQGIPIKNLVLETDSPDQAPPNWPHLQNHPSSLLIVAAQVAKIRGMTMDELRVKTAENLARVFPVAARHL